MSGWAEYYDRAEEIGADAAWQEREAAGLAARRVALEARMAAVAARAEAHHRMVVRQNIADWSQRAQQADRSTFNPLYTAWLEVDTGVFTGTDEEVHEHLLIAVQKLATLHQAAPSHTRRRA